MTDYQTLPSLDAGGQHFPRGGRARYNNAVFRNESKRLSSDIILEAERMAFAKWGPEAKARCAEVRVAWRLPVPIVGDAASRSRLRFTTALAAGAGSGAGAQERDL